MYSVVLMAALTTGGSTPDWCHHMRGCIGCSGCNGCTGCYGGCNGGCYGSYYRGCYGGCYGGAGYFDAYSCHGCYGCQGWYGGAGSSYAPLPPTMPPAGGAERSKESARPAKAKLLVEVPADAKLYIDDQLMKSTTSQRTFNTPPLDEGRSYYYILRAEVVREGKTYQDTKRVIVRAGEQVRTTFSDEELTASTAAKASSSR